LHIFELIFILLFYPKIPKKARKNFRKRVKGLENSSRVRVRAAAARPVRY